MSEENDCEIVEDDSARVFASQIGIKCKTHGRKASVNEIPENCNGIMRGEGDQE